MHLVVSPPLQQIIYDLWGACFPQWKKVVFFCILSCVLCIATAKSNDCLELLRGNQWPPKLFFNTLHLFCLFNLLSFLLIPLSRGGRILIWLMYLKPYHTSFFLCIFWNFSERLLSFRHREKEKESKTLFKDVDWEAHLIYVVFVCVCFFSFGSNQPIKH